MKTFEELYNEQSKKNEVSDAQIKLLLKEVLQSKKEIKKSNKRIESLESIVKNY